VSKKTAGLVSVLLLVLTIVLSAAPPLQGQSSGQISTIYISPVKTCCGSPNVPYLPGYTFQVDVNLSLVAGESINVFDVRVNYTNPHSYVVAGVLKAVSIDYSNNIFSAYGTSVLEDCVDGQPIPANGPTCPFDVLGQVHFAESILGAKLTGPLNGQLFGVTFQVTGNGTSTFAVDTAQAVNPTPDPSDPQLIGPEAIPLLKQGGIFGNRGVVAFFDYKPSNLSVSPSLLPNQPVVFDASASFVANDSSMGFRSYFWDFGDRQTANVSNPVYPHSYALPGNYTVSLNVTDINGETGILARMVSVLPALGDLSLTVQDRSGNLQRQNVRILLFNSSSSSLPIFNQTTDFNGHANIKGLVPATYYLTYKGQGIIPGSKSEKVIPGFTQEDTVFVSIVPTPPDLSGIIYLGTILGGLGAVGAAIAIQRTRSARRKRGSTARALKTVRSRSYNPR